MLTPATLRCREFGAAEGPDDERVPGNYGKVVLRAAFFLNDLLKRPASEPLTDQTRRMQASCTAEPSKVCLCRPAPPMSGPILEISHEHAVCPPGRL
jgi:hypothetical protein